MISWRHRLDFVNNGAILDGGLDRVMNIVYAKEDMARYDSLRKIKRNKTLKEYAKNNPDLSMKEIGQVFGISGSRVWRIINGHKKLAPLNNPYEYNRIE